MPGIAWISPGPVDLPDDALGFRACLTLRDPDGHSLRLVSAGEHGPGM